jgi:hypothetical protein
MLKDYFLTNKKILQTGLSTLKVNMSGSVRQFEEWITNFA